MRYVLNLNTGNKLYFTAKSGREAIKKCLYTVNLNNKDENAVIRPTMSGKCLYFDHHGETYATLND